MSSVDSAGNSLAGSTAIVTGAASGVGLCVTRALRARRATVVAVDLDPAVQELAHDNGVVAVTGDVSNPSVAEEAVNTAADRFGRLDILVNNAAQFLMKPLGETTADQFDQLMKVNVRSVFLFTRAAIPIMARQGSGSIINLSSIAGLVGLVNQAAYGATKGAIAAFTRATAIEYAESGIRVNAIAPGAISTQFLKDALDTAPDTQAALDAVAAAHPMKRVARPEEIAESVLMLADPISTFTTGATLAVDGGFTAT